MFVHLGFTFDVIKIVKTGNVMARTQFCGGYIKREGGKELGDVCAKT